MEGLVSDSAISCSLPELFTLASLLGGEVVIGVPDPFSGWLVEEIEEVAEKAHHTLVERNYLSVQPDGKILMDAVVAALVGTITYPQAILIVTDTTPDRESRRINLYHRSPMTIALTVEEERVVLKPLPTEAIADEILKTWQILAQKPAPATPFSIPEEILRQAKESLPSEEEARRFLEEAEVAPADAGALVEALAAPRRSGTLVAMRRHRENWDVKGVVALEGRNGLWLLRSFSRNQISWVECVPCSATKMQEEVRSLTRRFVFQEEV